MCTVPILKPPFKNTVTQKHAGKKKCGFIHQQVKNMQTNITMKDYKKHATEQNKRLKPNKATQITFTRVPKF